MQRLFIQLFGMFYKILKIHNCEDKKGKFFLKGRTNTLQEGGQDHKEGLKGKDDWTLKALNPLMTMSNLKTSPTPLTTNPPL